MSKLVSFVRLDFVTVKPYLTIKNLVIFAAVAIFLTMMSGNIGSVLGVGIMLGTLFVSYPFAIGEKSNMDALYATLSIDRKTVVTGRYLFALTFNISAILFSVVFAAIGAIISSAFGRGTQTGGIVFAGILLAAILIIIQALQLPFFFRFGYTKAKVFSIVPFIAIMAGYIVFMTALKSNQIFDQIGNTLEKLSSIVLIGPALFVLLLICYISYRLSVAFYKKREF